MNSLIAGKPTRRGRRIQMLHHLANNDSYVDVALKRAAKDRERWRSKLWLLRKL